MYRIESKVDPKSAEFETNRTRMLETVEEFRERLARMGLGGPESQRERHEKRGKLLVRDRLEKLFDPMSPFLELSPLAGHSASDFLAARLVYKSIAYKGLASAERG